MKQARDIMERNLTVHNTDKDTAFNLMQKFNRTLKTSFTLNYDPEKRQAVLVCNEKMTSYQLAFVDGFSASLQWNN